MKLLLLTPVLLIGGLAFWIANDPPSNLTDVRATVVTPGVGGVEAYKNGAFSAHRDTEAHTVVRLEDGSVGTGRLGDLGDCKGKTEVEAAVRIGVFTHRLQRIAFVNCYESVAK